MRTVREHVRCHADQHTLHGHAHISGQRRAALWSVIGNGVLVILWLIAMILMAAHFVLPHIGFIAAFYRLCQAVAFVTFISLYCNWATNLSAFIAGLAALFAADSHHDAEHTRRLLDGSTRQIVQDIERLADMIPGHDARVFAADINRRLPTIDTA